MKKNELNWTCSPFCAIKLNYKHLNPATPRNSGRWAMARRLEEKNWPSLTFIDLDFPTSFTSKGLMLRRYAASGFFSNLPKRYHGNEVRSFVLIILSNHSGWIELTVERKLHWTLKPGHLMPQNAMRNAMFFMKLGSMAMKRGEIPCPRGTWAMRKLLDCLTLFKRKSMENFGEWVACSTPTSFT